LFNPQAQALFDMSYPAALETFATLQPGDRVEVTHEIKIGFRNWNAKTIGTVVATDRRRHSLHFNRNFDDKVYSDVLILKRDDGELTTITVDEFSAIRRVQLEGEQGSK
jgi:hypothetical protein